MIAALAFLTFIALVIAIAARAIWIDSRHRARRPEATELGFDEDAGDALPFVSLGAAADAVVEDLDRRRA